jgi:hypothetical protein
MRLKFLLTEAEKNKLQEMMGDEQEGGAFEYNGKRFGIAWAEVQDEDENGQQKTYYFPIPIVPAGSGVQGQGNQYLPEGADFAFTEEECIAWAASIFGESPDLEDFTDTDKIIGQLGAEDATLKDFKHIDMDDPASPETSGDPALNKGPMDVQKSKRFGKLDMEPNAGGLNPGAASKPPESSIEPPKKKRKLEMDSVQKNKHITILERALLRLEDMIKESKKVNKKKKINETFGEINPKPEWQKTSRPAHDRPGRLNQMPQDSRNSTSRLVDSMPELAEAFHLEDEYNNKDKTPAIRNTIRRSIQTILKEDPAGDGRSPPQAYWRMSVDHMLEYSKQLGSNMPPELKAACDAAIKIFKMRK